MRGVRRMFWQKVANDKKVTDQVRGATQSQLPSAIHFSTMATMTSIATAIHFSIMAITASIATMPTMATIKRWQIRYGGQRNHSCHLQYTFNYGNHGKYFDYANYGNDKKVTDQVRGATQSQLPSAIHFSTTANIANIAQLVVGKCVSRWIVC